MQYKDEFDGPGFRGAIGAIFRALDKRDHIAPRRPIWAVAIVGTLVVFLASVLWYSYPRGTDAKREEAVPIIRADAGPYKVEPTDPGGMEIPHRDSTVFDTLRASREEGGNVRQVENLLSEPEEPVAREDLFAGLDAEIRVEGREVATIVDETPDEKVKVAVAAEPERAPADITEPVTVAEAVKEEPVKKAEAPAAQKVALAKPVPPAKPQRDNAEEISRTEPAAGVETFEGGRAGWYAQLGSLRSNEAARSAWNDMQKKVSALKTVEYRIEKADLGSRGVYYRVQAGPFAESRARQVCAAVEEQRPGGCLVVKN